VVNLRGGHVHEAGAVGGGEQAGIEANLFAALVADGEAIAKDGNFAGEGRDGGEEEGDQDDAESTGAKARIDFGCLTRR
jgi:hypothetical protein